MTVDFGKDKLPEHSGKKWKESDGSVTISGIRRFIRFTAMFPGCGKVPK